MIEGWRDISDNGHFWFKTLGNYSPTVTPAERCLKGDGMATHLDSTNLRSLSKACEEVAEWLDLRAESDDPMAVLEDDE